MGIIGNALVWITTFARDTLQSTGYVGLFLLMVAESMFLPVPSEAVMPLAGYLASKGEMSLPLILVVSSAGSMAGSYIGFGMGRFGLLPFARKYGKYVFIHEHQIEAAQSYFARKGSWAIFACRFIPGVRHVSSIPAGAARMSQPHFAVATLVGATLWNMFLCLIGYKYGEQAAVAVKPYLDVVGIGLLILIAAYVFYEIRKAKKSRTGPTNKLR